MLTGARQASHPHLASLPQLTDGAVTRSQSFSPASAATSAATIKATLLTWCQQRTRGYRGVDIRNFSSSWADGLAFAAISHSYAPDAFDFDELDPSDRRNTLEVKTPLSPTGSRVGDFRICISTGPVTTF